MAWTTPKTDFVSGNILTADQMNAIGENLNTVGGAWTSYTPTYTNLTIGNGTASAAYILAGKLCIVRFGFTLGSTSTVGTIPELTLPATGNGNYPTAFPIGMAGTYDLSADAGYTGPATFDSGRTKIRPFVSDASGTYVTTQAITATVPFTWATGDTLTLQVLYQTA